MYFEIYRNGKLIKTGRDVIREFTIHNELMHIPATRLVLPITYREYLSGREDFVLYFSDKVFQSIVTGVNVDKENEVVEVELQHAIFEWDYRQISVNNAVKNGKINVVYKGAQTNTSGGVSVTASDFTVLLQELGTITNSQIIDRSGASAWTTDGVKQSVSVNRSKIENKAGSYDVVFSSGSAKVTVQATVKENPKEVERDGYKMTASNFSVNVADVQSLTDANYIDRADATVTPTLPITVDSSTVKPTAGTYTVKFTSTYQKDGEDREINISVSMVVIGARSSEATVADNLSDIYADASFAYKGWNVKMSTKAKNTEIDYVYSRQGKLKALTKTMELTDDLFWRVSLTKGRTVEIGEFGDKKQMRISNAPSGINNRRIIHPAQVEFQFDHVVNVASVYSSKSDGGMNSMTLREVFEDDSLQLTNFPVVILRDDVNNERDYRKYNTQFPELAPNNDYEYAIIDLESVALENGLLLEGTFASDDIAPFNIDPNETRQVTNADRIKASQTIYKAGVRLLKQSRRRFKQVLVTEELPSWVNVGDMVLYDYDNNIFVMGECTDYMKKVLAYHDWYYLTQIDYQVTVGGAVMCQIVLEKYLHIEREIRNE